MGFVLVLFDRFTILLNIHYGLFHYISLRLHFGKIYYTACCANSGFICVYKRNSLSNLHNTCNGCAEQTQHTVWVAVLGSRPCPDTLLKLKNSWDNGRTKHLWGSAWSPHDRLIRSSKSVASCRGMEGWRCPSGNYLWFPKVVKYTTAKNIGTGQIYWYRSMN